MGSFSIWHLIIILAVLGVPTLVMLTKPPIGPNRFGPAPAPLNFSEAISRFFRDYVNFSGRASRSEFWYSMLVFYIVSALTSALNEFIYAIWVLATVIPLIAVTTRRLHDLNRSGWFQILAISPVGIVWLIVWYCKAADDADLAVSQPSHSMPTMASVDALEKLAKLRASGAITAEEFESEKRKILRN